MEDLVTEAVATIAQVDSAVLVVGGAIVALAAVAMGIRWVKATFF